MRFVRTAFMSSEKDWCLSNASRTARLKHWLEMRARRTPPNSQSLGLFVSSRLRQWGGKFWMMWHSIFMESVLSEGASSGFGSLLVLCVWAPKCLGPTFPRRAASGWLLIPPLQRFEDVVPAESDVVALRECYAMTQMCSELFAVALEKRHESLFDTGAVRAQPTEGFRKGNGSPQVLSLGGMDPEEAGNGDVRLLATGVGWCSRQDERIDSS